MRVYRVAVLAIATFTAAAVPLAAQEARNVEVTPYVALGTGGAAPVGVAVTFPVTSKLSVETDMAYRRGEGNINALSSDVSLLLFLPRIGKAAPYAVGGIGLAQYGSPVFSPAGGPPIGTQSQLAFRINAGGGLKMPMNDKLDLRTDARWYKSFGNQGSEQFHVAQGLSFDVGKRK